MIKKIQLCNFKGISEPVTLKLFPITLLFGANSAGKSTFLHSLLYSREIFLNNNFDPYTTDFGSDVINLGGFRNLVYMRDTDASIGLKYFFDEINFSLYKNRSSLFDNLFTTINGKKDYWIEIKLKWSENFSRPRIDELSFGTNTTTILSLSETNYFKEPITFKITHLSSDLYPFSSGIEADSSDQNNNGEIATSFSKRLNDFLSLLTSDNSSDPLAIFNLPTGDDFIVGIQTCSSLYQTSQSTTVDNSSIKAEEIVRNNLFVMSLLLLHLKTDLANLLYLGPVRKLPPRDFQPEGKGKVSRWVQGYGAWDEISSDTRLTPKVNFWLDKFKTDLELQTLKQITLFDFDAEAVKRTLSEYGGLSKEDEDSLLNSALSRTFTLTGNKEYDEILEKLRGLANRAVEIATKVKLMTRSTGVVLSPFDTGFGISQIFPVIIAVLSQAEKPNSILCIEQPELHLHPAAQVEIGDLLIEGVKNFKGTSNSNIMLIETHSEHLILRLLRRIGQTFRKGKEGMQYSLSHTDLGVYWCSSKSGQKPIVLLDLTKDGEFSSEWPEEFFPERDEELFSNE